MTIRLNVVEKYSIPNSVTYIGNETFTDCQKLTSIMVPNSVTYIGSNPFIYCNNLTDINVSDHNLNYKSENGVLFSKDGTELIAYPKGKSNTNYIIPVGVIAISNSSFKTCTSLTSVTIPESVTNIGIYAFGSCKKLESIVIYNDSIKIYDNISTLGNKDITTLYGNKNSNTEAYANKYGYQFKELEDLEKSLISISLAKTNITLKVGKSTLNSIIYNPTDTTDDKVVKWSSSDLNVTRVLTNGKIQALSKGTAVITATVGDKIATCNVTVTE